jgi:hypothetical protein
VFRTGSNYGLEVFPSAAGAPTFKGGTAHDFDPGPGVSNFQRISIPAGETSKFSVQWDRPAFSVSGGTGSANDVDAYMFNEAGTMVVAGSATESRGGDPIEFFTATNTSEALVTVKLGVFHNNGVDGPEPGLIKYIHFDSAAIIDFSTNSSTIVGHANAEGAGSVAAAGYADIRASGTSSPVAKTFTSQGGTKILFDSNGEPVSIDRQKPDFTGIDGADTTFFGSDSDFNGLPNYFGTSAAAPHVAAIAALILEGDSTLTPIEIYSILETTAVDVGTSGFDNFTGHGLIDATAAVSALGAPVALDGTDLSAGQIVASNDTGTSGVVVLTVLETAAQEPSPGYQEELAVVPVPGAEVDPGFAREDRARMPMRTSEHAETLTTESAVTTSDLLATEIMSSLTPASVATPLPISTPTLLAAVNTSPGPAWWIVVGGVLALAVLPGIGTVLLRNRS